MHYNTLEFIYHVVAHFKKMTRLFVKIVGHPNNLDLLELYSTDPAELYFWPSNYKPVYGYACYRYYAAYTKKVVVYTVYRYSTVIKLSLIHI